MSVPPKRPTANAKAMMGQKRPKTAMQAQKQARSTGRAQPMTAAQQKAAMDQLFRKKATAQKKTGTARSTGKAQPMKQVRTALAGNAGNKGIQSRQVTPAELSRIVAGNKHRNTKRPPKQAVQIKPSASKTKGPTNAPLKSRRASAQNRMAQRKASMMARRSK